MTFEPQNLLERSLVKAASDPAHRPQFYKDLVQSDIFIIQPAQRPQQNAGRVTLDAGRNIEIRNVEFNGKRYIPIFSSLPRLQATLTSEASYIGMNALEFLKMTRGAALLLNPGSDYGKEITAEEAASIMDGSIWQPNERYVAKKETQVMIGQPQNFPTELVEALTRLFKQKRQVKRAWVAHFFNPDTDQKPHTLLAVEVTDGFDEVSAEVGIVARNVRLPDPPVDIMRITGRGGIEDYFTKTTPFYERRTLGLF